MSRHSTPLTEEKHSVKGSLTCFLGENAICSKDIPKLEEWTTFSGEREYNHIEFIRTIDMFQEDFQIPDEDIVGKLHSVTGALMEARGPGTQESRTHLEGSKR
ncbi:hypothetical protein O181_120050 [Austropuccinia psidii MF-1]|uniref:Uncharacterized protein n=1 Tax=Austropuccinia psidii MF-1 TaxID=1389203 RepID=A0A9Q3KF35_9BASI|nr:hypothetical protein [Austropuccinia psidii MF-1]